MEMSQPIMKELINKLEMDAMENSDKFEKLFDKLKRIKPHLY